MSDWRTLYTATMEETDAKQLEVLIENTSRLLEARLDELWRTQGSEVERKKIYVAANALLSLKVARRTWEKKRPN
jgi:hypothetical protein